MNKTAAEQLASLEELQDGWDSYGGVKPDRTALAIARTITSRIPSITPAGDGSVLLEWHVDGFDLEIWIDPGVAVRRGADLR